MKKTLLTSLLVVCLSGCSAHSGQINCEEIKAIKDGYSVFYGKHKDAFERVYEYRGKMNNKEVVLYTDCVWQTYYHYPNGSGYVSCENVTVYPNKDSDEHSVFYYEREVGPIGVTRNYYLDLKTRTIESESLYNDTALSYPQFREMKGAEEAYECAKKGYYHITQTHYVGTDNVVYLDENQQGLELHTFETFDETVEFEYIELK